MLEVGPICNITGKKLKLAYFSNEMLLYLIIVYSKHPLLECRPKVWLHKFYYSMMIIVKNSIESKFSLLL